MKETKERNESPISQRERKGKGRQNESWRPKKIVSTYNLGKFPKLIVCYKYLMKAYHFVVFQRKTSKSSSLREKIGSDSDTDSSFNSDWSASVKTEPTQYKLRNRSQKVSEQSECTTSYSYRTSESSNCGALQLKMHADESNQLETPHPVNLSNDPALSAIPECEEFTVHCDDQIETALLDTLSKLISLIIS